MLIPVGEQCEEHFHFISTLLDIAEIIDNERIELIQTLQQLIQPQLGFGQQQALHQQHAGDKEDRTSLADQFMAQRA